MIAPVYRPGPPWYCGIDGTENTEDWERCKYCNQPKGDWVCGCGRRNRKTDDECSDCGNAKPDDVE